MIGAATHEYQQAKPFPHIVLDNFLRPEVLKEVIKEWPSGENWHFKSCDTSIKFSLTDYNRFGPTTQSVFDELNSSEFLEILSILTGIPGLVSDPTLKGGGLHEIPPGGFLKMHADFNYLPEFGLARKLNLLVYLNENWDESWCGDLELVGPPGVEDTKVIIPPVFNRAVIFNTTSDSWHGHPAPMRTPQGVSRRSLALYYYCAEPRPANVHSTLYRPDLETKTYTNILKV